MWKRIKENAPAAAAVATVFVGFAAIVQLGVLNPIQQRIDDLQAGLNQRFEDQNRSINQRFDAIDQRFNDLRIDMNQRFNDLRAVMNQRFDDQDKYIRQRFDAVEQRFDAVDQRIDQLSGDVSDLRKLSDRVSRNEGRIDAVTQQQQAADAPGALTPTRSPSLCKPDMVYTLDRGHGLHSLVMLTQC